MILENWYGSKYSNVFCIQFSKNCTSLMYPLKLFTLIINVVYQEKCICYREVKMSNEIKNVNNIASWMHPWINYLCLSKTDYSSMASLAAKEEIKLQVKWNVL